MSAPETAPLVATRCGICGSYDNADEVYPATFQTADLNPNVFSARRTPDRVHYRIVKCRSCGLLRSDPVADSSIIADLYASSSFSYGGEIDNLRQTYGSYLRRCIAAGARAGTLLDIGCGNGFVLEEALNLGYREVIGVEPGADAVQKASPAVRDRIVCDMMRPGLFPESSVDVITMFQVLDHCPDPAEVLSECRRVLRPGGFLLALNHNARAVSARLLGERSPIFDIEHTYLYDIQSMTRLLEAAGFTIAAAGSVWNRYSLEYLVRLMPAPPVLKGLLQTIAAPFPRLSISAPLGNLYVIGMKQQQ